MLYSIQPRRRQPTLLIPMARLEAPPSAATILPIVLFLTAAAAEPQQIIGVKIIANAAASVEVNPTPLLSLPGKKARGAIAREFVDAHNKVRAGVHHAPLVWDRKLATFARRWAEQRVKGGDCKSMIHSNGPYGENLFWSERSHWTPAKVVENWAAEEKYFDPNTNSCIGGQKCFHFTQIVWKSTQRVGCAWAPCLNNGGFFTVCNYDPPGNYKYESPFQ